MVIVTGNADEELGGAEFLYVYESGGEFLFGEHIVNFLITLNHMEIISEIGKTVHIEIHRIIDKPRPCAPSKLRA